MQGNIEKELYHQTKGKHEKGKNPSNAKKLYVRLVVRIPGGIAPRHPHNKTIQGNIGQHERKR